MCGKERPDRAERPLLPRCGLFLKGLCKMHASLNMHSGWSKATPGIFVRICTMCCPHTQPNMAIYHTMDAAPS